MSDVDNGSFISRNIGGIILTAVLSIIAWISSKNFGFFILAIPFTFVGYLIGNRLRKLLHPDFVIADGFWGILKEQVFWKFGPQLIGALIGLAIGTSLIGEKMLGLQTVQDKSQNQQIEKFFASRLIDGNNFEPTNSDIKYSTIVENARLYGGDWEYVLSVVKLMPQGGFVSNGKEQFTNSLIHLLDVGPQPRVVFTKAERDQLLRELKE
jgi:hypothetical protein